MALSQELQQHVMDALSKNETFLKANQADQVEIARGAMQHMEESQSSAWRSPGPHTMPNEKNESFVGTQTPRSVGDAVPGMVEGGVDMYGAMRGGAMGAAQGARFGPYGALIGGAGGAAVGGGLVRGGRETAKSALGIEPKSLDELMAEGGRGAFEGGAGELGRRKGGIRRGIHFML